MALIAFKKKHRPDANTTRSKFSNPNTMIIIKNNIIIYYYYHYFGKLLVLNRERRETIHKKTTADTDLIQNRFCDYRSVTLSCCILCNHKNIGICG